MKSTNAERGLLEDTREDTFAGIRTILTGKAARLERNPIPGEKRIELVKGKPRRSSGAYEEEIALSEVRLNGRGVDRLKQLRLKQFTDPRDLVARQDRVRIGEKPVGGEVSWIDIDGFPAFYQSKLLES